MTPLSNIYQAMEPSICSVISRFSSTAYSIGSSLVNWSQNPLTMMLRITESVLIIRLGRRRRAIELMLSSECPLRAVQRRVPETLDGGQPPPTADSTSAHYGRQLFSVAGGNLDLNLPRLGILGFGHRQH